MSDKSEEFPRAVFDTKGEYTVRRGASYITEDPRLRELAEVGYARRDLERAYEYMFMCATVDEDRAALLEASLWSAAISSYARPFGKNNARPQFEAEGFVRTRLDPVGLKKHGYIRRCRDKWIAHDDGFGESKSVAIYLPPSPPRSRHEIGLHFPSRRVVSLGTEIAQALLSHIAGVSTLLASHEKELIDRIGAELVATRFLGVNILGVASEDDLVEEFRSILSFNP